MDRYTINLSRARAVGRKKRAGKAVRILTDELEKKEGEITISRELNQEIWKRGAKKPPAKVSVKIEEENGGKTAYPVEDRADTTSTSQTSSDVDYSEVVSGTISDAKEEIGELDNPDYDSLLEAEKEGKDRKTLKDWIQAQE